MRKTPRVSGAVERQPQGILRLQGGITSTDRAEPGTEQLIGSKSGEAESQERIRVVSRESSFRTISQVLASLDL